jgi:hypothetical protein
MKHLIPLLLIGLSIQCRTKNKQDLLGSWREVYPKYQNATNYDSLVFTSSDSLKTYTITNSYVTDTLLETFTLTKDGYLKSTYRTQFDEGFTAQHRIVKLTADSLIFERGNGTLIRYKRTK